MTVRDVLTEARRLGFLGPGPLDRHIEHAREFAAALAGSTPELAADLGAGGGVPGLVLAGIWPHTRLLLVEGGARRARFLEDAVDRLGLRGRVEVRAARAELVGRDGAVRGRCDVVVARSFGPPAVTAECGAPLLRTGGYLVVSDPPGAESPERWPAGLLAEVGLAPEGRWVGPGGTMQVLRQVAPCPSRYPRRVGVPGKRPLF